MIDEQGNVLEQAVWTLSDTNEGEEKIYDSCNHYERDEYGFVTRSWQGKNPDEFDESQMEDEPAREVTLDDDGRIIRAASDTLVTEYEYDKQGNLTKQTSTYVDQYTSTITYGSDGWATSSSFEPTKEYAEANDAEASDTTYEYERDADGRVTRSTVKALQSMIVNEYTYDENGNVATCKLATYRGDGSEIEGSYAMLYEYTYQYVEDPSPVVALVAQMH